MPLYDVECDEGHRAETLLSVSEKSDLLAQHGDIVVPCVRCGRPARRQLSLTASMGLQWRRAVEGHTST